MQDSSLLLADNVACERGGRLLFSGVSFMLSPGQSLHITGANGIGKTSLMRILAGLMRPLAGNVEQRAKAALIDQQSALDPNQTLSRALGFWAALDCGQSRQTEAANRLGLTDLMDIPVRFLSTGQQKRAAFARLAGQDATIWLLDEPLNGLDSEGVAIVEAMIGEHCGRGGVVVVASHQPISLPEAQMLALAKYQP